MKKTVIKSKIRAGLKDVWWKHFMVRGAIFDLYDIPFCPTTADRPPIKVITYSEAKAIYRREIRKDPNFKFPAFVCFYEDDIKFDGILGIWFRCDNAYKILKHFDGIITPDFSLYQDFPLALKLWNIYRMRAFGYWIGVICGMKVINNIRWGTAETYWYCWLGIEKDSIVAVGTVGGSPRKKCDRLRFESGIYEMVRVLRPKTIIVYGSTNYPCFKKLAEMGIEIIPFRGKTSEAFARRKAV